MARRTADEVRSRARRRAHRPPRSPQRAAARSRHARRECDRRPMRRGPTQVGEVNGGSNGWVASRRDIETREAASPSPCSRRWRRVDDPRRAPAERRAAASESASAIDRSASLDSSSSEPASAAVILERTSAPNGSCRLGTVDVARWIPDAGVDERRADVGGPEIDSRDDLGTAEAQRPSRRAVARGETSGFTPTGPMTRARQARRTPAGARFECPGFGRIGCRANSPKTTRMPHSPQIPRVPHGRGQRDTRASRRCGKGRPGRNEHGGAARQERDWYRKRPRAAYSDEAHHAVRHRPTTHDVHVQMLHGLRGVAPIVDDHPVTRCPRSPSSRATSRDCAEMLRGRRRRYVRRRDSHSARAAR